MLKEELDGYKDGAQSVPLTIVLRFLNTKLQLESDQPISTDTDSERSLQAAHLSEKWYTDRGKKHPDPDKLREQIEFWKG
jgi:hypothetical protein